MKEKKKRQPNRAGSFFTFPTPLIFFLFTFFLLLYFSLFLSHSQFFSLYTFSHYRAHILTTFDSLHSFFQFHVVHSFRLISVLFSSTTIFLASLRFLFITRFCSASLRLFHHSSFIVALSIFASPFTQSLVLSLSSLPTGRVFRSLTLSFVVGLSCSVAHTFVLFLSPLLSAHLLTPLTRRSLQHSR